MTVGEQTRMTGTGRSQRGLEEVPLALSQATAAEENNGRIIGSIGLSRFGTWSGRNRAISHQTRSPSRLLAYEALQAQCFQLPWQRSLISLGRLSNPIMLLTAYASLISAINREAYPKCTLFGGSHPTLVTSRTWPMFGRHCEGDAEATTRAATPEAGRILAAMRGMTSSALGKQRFARELQLMV